MTASDAVATLAPVVAPKKHSSPVDPEQLSQAQGTRGCGEWRGWNVESLEALRLVGTDAEERR